MTANRRIFIPCLLNKLVISSISSLHSPSAAAAAATWLLLSFRGKAWLCLALCQVLWAARVATLWKMQLTCLKDFFFLILFYFFYFYFFKRPAELHMTAIVTHMAHNEVLWSHRTCTFRALAAVRVSPIKTSSETFSLMKTPVLRLRLVLNSTSSLFLKFLSIKVTPNHNFQK